MSNKPKISIITACYNAEKTIEQTILSVLNQTHENIEYIIIDGASTDRTMDIVEKYRQKVDVIISEPDQGIYDAFNKGVFNATGHYIHFLNADDYFVDKNVISKITSFIDENEFPIVAYGGVLVKDEKSGYIKEINKYVSIKEMSEGSMIPHQAIFVKREKILEFKGFDINYKIASDLDLLSKLYLKYEKWFKYVPLRVVVFRLGGISSELLNRQLLRNEYQEILRKHFNSNFNIGKETNNEAYLKAWMQSILFSNKRISNVLKEKSIERVVIFGSGEISNMVAKDFTDNGIVVEAFLDNNIQTHNLVMNSIEIVSPTWLIENSNKIQAIIFGFEGNHEEEVLKQLAVFNLSKNIEYYSWRELVVAL